MMRRSLLLLLVIPLGGCINPPLPVIRTPQSDITLGAGRSTTIVVASQQGSGLGLKSSPPPPLVSSDPSIVMVSQSSNSTNVTLQAFLSGTAYISVSGQTKPLITVHVFDCVPVGVEPIAATVGATVGTPVELQVITEGAEPILTSWYEEAGQGWLDAPLGSGNSYQFTPRVSGTYRFQARYQDRCGDADTIITVEASSRGRAARH
jgi:hypothetical protein